MEDDKGIVEAVCPVFDCLEAGVDLPADFGVVETANVWSKSREVMPPHSFHVLDCESATGGRPLLAVVFRDNTGQQGSRHFVPRFLRSDVHGDVAHLVFCQVRAALANLGVQNRCVFGNATWRPSVPEVSAKTPGDVQGR